MRSNLESKLAAVGSCRSGRGVLWLALGLALVCVAAISPASAICQSSGKSCGVSTISNDRLCCPGTVCGWGGRCQAACRINGVLYQNGATNPANPCQSCQPRVSTTRWTNLSTGTALAGTRTVVSDFGDATQGPLGDSGASGVAVETSGQILVVDYDGGPNRMGALFRVDPVTGVRTLLSDFGNSTQGQVGKEPNGVAVEASGQILVADTKAGTNGMLFRVNPTTGERTVLSDFGDAGKGPLGSYPYGVAVEASGKILVEDQVPPAQLISGRCSGWIP